MEEAVRLEINAGVADLLKRVLRLEGFFPEFTPEEAVKLFPRSGLFAYARGQVLVLQGWPGRDLYIVHAGRISIEKMSDSATTTVATLGPGGLFGEIAFLRGGVRTATATVLEDSKIFRLNYSDMQYLLAHNNELSVHLKALAFERLGDDARAS